MKKFLKKFPVMLAFVIVAVALLGVYVGLLARPVATGMNYSYTVNKEEWLKEKPTLAAYGEDTFTKLKFTTKIKLVNGKKMVMSSSVDYKFAKDVEEAERTLIENTFLKPSEGEEEGFYYRSGNKIYILGMGTTEKNYDDAVKTLKAGKDWEKNYSFTVNSFNLKAKGALANKYKKPFVCAGTIALTVVLGVVEVTLLVFAGLSVAAYTKSKKKA